MSGRLKVDALEWEKLRAYWVVAAVCVCVCLRALVISAWAYAQNPSP